MLLPILGGAAALLYLASRKPKTKGGLWVIGFQAPAAYPGNEIVWRAIALEMGWDWSEVTNMAINYANGVNYVNVAFSSDYAAEMPKVGSFHTIAGMYSKVVSVQRQPGNV
jgi:hypothetical protein